MKKAKLYYCGWLISLLSAIPVAFIAQQSGNASPYLKANKLFLSGETPKVDEYCKEEFIEDGYYGALYLTKKGHMIFNLNNEKQDTMRYFWGDYQLLGSQINIQLHHEFYYAGKWDASWIAADPDYKKGKVRSVNLPGITLLKTHCDSLSYYNVYSKAEQMSAAKRTDKLKPKGLYFFPYYETKDMKFYTWFYKQVPVLANL